MSLLNNLHGIKTIKKDNSIVVSTERTEVELSLISGSIIKISDVQTGKIFCSVEHNPKYARLFRIISMTNDQRSCCCDSHLQSDVIWEVSNERVTMRYPVLTFEGNPTKCSALVNICSQDGQELQFFMEIDNSEYFSIHEIQFPILPGWSNSDGSEPIELTAGAKWKWQVGRLPKFGFPAYAKWYQQLSVNYPGTSMYMPWLDFTQSGIGISMINYMTRPYWGGIAGTNLVGHEKGNLEAYWWRHYPLIKNGMSWISAPIGISIHDGDWHRTANRYYDWFKTAVGIDIEQPISLRTAIGYQNIMLRTFDAHSYNGIETIPEHARIGRSYGVDHLVIWDQPTLGSYCIDPNDDLLNYTSDEKESLKNAIDTSKKEGTITSALINVRHINVSSDLYNEYKSDAVLCLDGSEVRENWMGCDGTSQIFTNHLGGNCILLSPRSPNTHSRVNELLDKYIELGYNAVFYDQPFLYYLDYNYMGNDCRPDDASFSCYSLVEQVRNRIRKLDIDAYVIGEQFDIFSSSKAIDLTMEWNFTNAGIEDLARIFYSCPHALLSYVIDYTTTAEAHASHAFAVGLLLCITIDGSESNLSKRPELAKHISNLAVLRKKCANRMAFGTFYHTEGLKIEGDEDVVAYAYNSAEGPAVSIAAKQNGGKIKVQIDLSKFNTPENREKCKLYVMDGDVLNIGTETILEYTLKPNEAVIWYC